jgi:hypothetical protein
MCDHVFPAASASAFAPAAWKGSLNASDTRVLYRPGGCCCWQRRPVARSQYLVCVGRTWRPGSNQHWSASEYTRWVYSPYGCRRAPGCRRGRCPWALRCLAWPACRQRYTCWHRRQALERVRGWRRMSNCRRFRGYGKSPHSSAICSHGRPWQDCSGNQARGTGTYQVYQRLLHGASSAVRQRGIPAALDALILRTKRRP